MASGYKWMMIGVGIFFVLVCIFGLLLGGVGVFLALFLTILIVIIMYRKTNGVKNSILEVMWYKEEYKALAVINGHSKCDRVIKIKKMVDYNLQYHPSQYVYTGATVGGVHVGGVQDVGNYYSVNGTSTEKYCLEYYGNDVDTDKLNTIDMIILGNPGDPIKEKARNDRFISQFLNEHGNLVLKHKVPSKTHSTVAAALDGNNTNLALQSMKVDYYNQQLTKEECERIVNWLRNLNV